MQTIFLQPRISPANYNIFEIINFKWYQALPRWYPQDPDPMFLSNLNRWYSNVAWHSRYRSRYPHSLQYMALRSITLDDIQQLTKVLKNPNFDINQVIDKKYKLTALQYAAMKNKFHIIQLLLLHGANINKPDAEGNTPLMMAVQNQSLQSINSLLKNGCNRTLANIYGMTPTQKAVNEESSNIAEFIEKYPNIRRRYPKFRIKLDIENAINSPTQTFLENYKIFSKKPIKNPFNNFKGEYRIMLSDYKTIGDLIKQKTQTKIPTTKK